MTTEDIKSQLCIYTPGDHLTFQSQTIEFNIKHRRATYFRGYMISWIFKTLDLLWINFLRMKVIINIVTREQNISRINIFEQIYTLYYFLATYLCFHSH